MKDSTVCLFFAFLSLFMFTLGFYFMAWSESVSEMFKYLLTVYVLGGLYAVWIYLRRIWVELERGERR